MDNQSLAQIFGEMAELLELKADNPFKIRAYQKIARNLASLPRNLSDIYNEGGLKALEEIPGIGEHTALKIEEYIKTGKLKAYLELKRQFPKDFLKLVSIPGVGPKTALLLYNQLGIDSILKLEKAAKAGKLKGLPGMGEKKEENILRGIAFKQQTHGRFLLDAATSQAELLVEELEKLPEVKKVLPCGSLRRGQETIGDLDLLVVSHQPAKVMETFVSLPYVKNVLAKGGTKSSVILLNGMQADLRVVEEKSFGAAAHYFTGCKNHNIHLRQLAQSKGWKVSEYGIFKGRRQIGGATEEEMFSKLDLQYIPPELREMRGEFEAAEKGNIPHLVTQANIQGDLHLHTTASDGVNSIEEMADAAKKMGYKYILITDHSRSSRIAKGLKEKDLLEHIKKIRAANQKIPGIEILAGAEVDVLADGQLDYADEILRQLDIVVAAIHSSFRLPSPKTTTRIIKALQNKYVKIFAHPTGRLIGEREAYAVDMDAILKAAKEYGVAMEINAHPKRLDLSDIYCQRAKELGVKMVVSTDAHATNQLPLMQYGVITARRGWLEAKDVLNTYPLERMIKYLRH